MDVEDGLLISGSSGADAAAVVAVLDGQLSLLRSCDVPWRKKFYLIRF